MKTFVLTLCGAALLAGCNQTASVESTPAATAPPVAATESRFDSAQTAAVAPTADGTAAAPSPAKPTPKLSEVETLKLSFAFKPVPDPDDPRHPRTSAHLLVQGSKPQNIDLGKFVGQPDVVNAEKAKQAGFPSGMLMGFRSYQASSGTSFDLAVLHVDGRYLRIVQRRVEETAPEAGKFETSREVPLPANTMVVAAPLAKK